MITRFAPTPSGYLHVGNAVNAVLVSWLAQQHDGTVALRIDDMDAPRARPAYVDDIFEVLAWLGVAWQVGPRDAADLAAHHSQRLRTDAYRAELAAAQAMGLEVYACSCSRGTLSGPPTGGCPGGCRYLTLPYTPGKTALRVYVPVGTSVDTGAGIVHLDQAMGDFVMWRRDDLPAYQLASLVEDRDLGTTHVVRGVDLIDSTAAQLFLAPAFDATAFTSATFLHHALVTTPDGMKLSKSQSATGRTMERTTQQRADVLRLAATLAEPLGVSPPR